MCMQSPCMTTLAYAWLLWIPHFASLHLHEGFHQWQERIVCQECAENCYGMCFEQLYYSLHAVHCFFSLLIHVAYVIVGFDMEQAIFESYSCSGISLAIIGVDISHKLSKLEALLLLSSFK